MADAKTKKRIREVLRREFFTAEDDVVNPRNGHVSDLVHLDVVSRKFDNLDWVEAYGLLESAVFKHLTPDLWGAISLLTPIPHREVVNGNSAPIRKVSKRNRNEG